MEDTKWPFLVNGRVPRPIHEPLYLPVILELRPVENTPRILSLPRKAVNLKDQVEKWIYGGYSLNQVANKLGASKAWVNEFTQAHQIEVPKSGRITNPDNYRHHTLPFGYKKKDGRLIPNRNQQRVCKLVVQLRKVEELSFNAIAKEIISGGHLNGKGGHYWDHKAVKKIYETWKDKY